MDEKDDEITLDFSKIKNFFKKKKVNEGIKVKVDDGVVDVSQEKTEVDNKSEAKVNDNKSKDKESDEISFDFNKIKSFFKSSDKTSEKIEKDDEDVSFDIKSTFNFFNKHKSSIILILALLIPLFFSIFFRMQTAYLPATDDWAQNSVFNYYRNQIGSQINSQYPNLPDANKNALIDQQFNKLLQERQDMVEQQIKETSAFFKSKMQDDRGQTYLIAIDPYFWLRHAENVLKNGHPGDEIRDGKMIDNHMLAPLGRAVPKDMFYAYFQAYAYNIVRIFNRDINPAGVVFYLPIFLSALSIFPAFFIGRKIGGTFGGFIAAGFIAIHPSFLTRTMGGISDTDGFNILFPLLITWFVFEAIESKKAYKTILFSVFAGLISGLFSFSWGGWWYIFDFILLSLAVIVIYELIIYHKELKKGILHFINYTNIRNTLTTSIVFFISSAIFTTILSGFTTFNAFLTGPGFFIRLKEVAIDTVWPNVFTTVAEQNPSSFEGVINQMGGKFFLALVILGIILCLLKKDKQGKPDIKYFSLFTIWLISTIYASVKGVRFTLLLVPVFGLALGICLGLILKHVSNFIANHLNINKKIAVIIIGALLLVIMIEPFNQARAMSRTHVSDMNDAWYESLERIKQQSKPDAIVNSWWDFGHWFKYIADRAVTFDGTSQGTPMSHWIGNALLTSDEKTAVGILRMVDCGSNNAFVELNKVIDDTPKSVELLYKIIVMDKENASKTLKNYGLSNEQINSVLKNTHCDPPEDFFITSEDMVGKSGVWAHFGSWDFNRALMYNKVKSFTYDKESGIEFLKNRFNFTDSQADNLYFEIQAIKDSTEANSWIAPWPSYASGLSGCRKVDDKNIICGFGNGGQANINLDTMEANIPTPQQVFHPNSLVIVAKEGIKRKRYDNATAGISIAIIPNGAGGYDSLLMSPQLDASMFTRMFFMEGHDLKYFDKFSDERTVFGGRIIIWKVDWEGKDGNVAPYFIDKKTEAPIENNSKDIVSSNDTVDNKSVSD